MTFQKHTYWLRTSSCITCHSSYKVVILSGEPVWRAWFHQSLLCIRQQWRYDIVWIKSQICILSMRSFPWASCQIRKFAGAHAPGMPGTFSPSPQVSDPDMHHGTCVTHVPWCMPGSLTSGFLWNRRRGKTFPAFPAHAQPAILRIW